jgi:prevent-host-death family protein
MNRLPASKVRKRFSEAISRAAYGGERIIIERSGKPLAALISMEDLEALEVLEDLMDVEEARRRLQALDKASDNVTAFEAFERELDAESA